MDSPNPEIAEIAMTLSAILDGIGPAEYQQFAAAILAASDLGQDTIDGAAAHHFRALVDPEKSAAALDLTMPPAPSTESSTPSGRPAPVRVDVWLDELGRVVTTTTTQTVADQQVISTNHVTRVQPAGDGHCAGSRRRRHQLTSERARVPIVIGSDPVLIRP